MGRSTVSSITTTTTSYTNSTLPASTLTTSSRASVVTENKSLSEEALHATGSRPTLWKTKTTNRASKALKQSVGDAVRVGKGMWQVADPLTELRLSFYKNHISRVFNQHGHQVSNVQLEDLSASFALVQELLNAPNDEESKAKAQVLSQSIIKLTKSMNVDFTNDLNVTNARLKTIKSDLMKRYLWTPDNVLLVNTIAVLRMQIEDEERVKSITPLACNDKNLTRLHLELANAKSLVRTQTFDYVEHKLSKDAFTNLISKHFNSTQTGFLLSLYETNNHIRVLSRQLASCMMEFTNKSLLADEFMSELTQLRTASDTASQELLTACRTATVEQQVTIRVPQLQSQYKEIYPEIPEKFFPTTLFKHRELANFHNEKNKVQAWDAEILKHFKLLAEYKDYCYKGFVENMQVLPQLHTLLWGHDYVAQPQDDDNSDSTSADNSPVLTVTSDAETTLAKASPSNHTST